jgi:hypothetical protein
VAPQPAVALDLTRGGARTSTTQRARLVSSEARSKLLVRAAVVGLVPAALLAIDAVVLVVVMAAAG